MTLISESSIMAHDSKRVVNLQSMAAYPAPFCVGKVRGALATIALVMAMSGVSHAEQTRKAAPDLFAGDTWHAVKGSWPGTIKFDGKTHKVVLEPIGSNTIQATYAYTLTPATSAKGKRGGAPAVREGTLTMTNSVGQTSISAFRLEGKELTLSFPGGLQAEHYLQMSKVEEEAEKRRIKKLAAEGKLNLPR